MQLFVLIRFCVCVGRCVLPRVLSDRRRGLRVSAVYDSSQHYAVWPYASSNIVYVTNGIDS